MRTRGCRLTRVVLAFVVGALGAACAGSPLSGSSQWNAARPGGEWFVQTGCTACHSVSVYGVINLAGGAPDLSLAVEDVPRRFGRPLEDFLRAPSGTMAIVLSSRIALSGTDRLIALEKLREAYRLHEEQRVGAPVASH